MTEEEYAERRRRAHDVPEVDGPSAGVKGEK